MGEGVCFLDVETTGLDPDRHEIWEVGLILPVGGGSYLWQLPVDLGRADPKSLAMNGFHDRRADGAVETRHQNGDVTWYMDTAKFTRQFARLTRGLHLVGANVGFDADRLWRLLRANGECPMWHYHIIDVEALAAGYLATGVAPKAWPGVDYAESLHRPPWRSVDLSLAVGVDPERFDRHSALGDARWAKAVYDAVMG